MLRLLDKPANQQRTLSTMDWDNLRIFLAIARAGQILSAAKALQLNHATVARRLDALEESLNTKLFERRTTGAVLTPVGEKLLVRVERMESEVLQADAATVSNTINGIVRVGAPDGFGTFHLAPCLARLANLHPQLTIQLVPLPRSFSLSRREADIIVTIERPKLGRAIIKKLTDYSLSVYASKSYLKKTGLIREQSDLENRLFITYVEDITYSRALDYTAELAKRMPRHYECGSVVAQMEAVRSGEGIGILHDYAAAAHADLVRVLPEMRFNRTYWLMSHPDTHDTRRVAEVYRAIVESVQQKRSAFMQLTGH
jgi:molybdate transport repressor ModE-like protein